MSPRIQHAITIRIRRFISLLILLIIITSIAFLLGIYDGFTDLDYDIDLNDINSYKLTTEIYDKHGYLLFNLHSSEDRKYLSIDEIPQTVKDIFIEVEDKRFYTHNGVDIKGIFRAIKTNLVSHSLSEGASTITQQLVRAVFLTNEKSFERKIKEQRIALDLEKKFSKDEILEAYLNTVYFGNSKYGIYTACKYYYGKEPKDMSINEIASLVPIVQAPNSFNPKKSSYKNNNKRIEVLTKLRESNYIDYNKYNTIIDTNPFVKIYDTPNNILSWYFDTVIFDVRDSLCKSLNISDEVALRYIYTKGLKIYTSYNKDIESIIDKAYIGFDKVQSSFIVIDNETQNIVGIKGGTNVKEGNLAFNRATQAVRQPGSTFKILASYIPAIDLLDFKPDSILVDKYRRYGKWSPSNWYSGYKGSVPLRQGISISINTIAVDLLDRIGVNTSIDYLTRMGISTLTETDNVLPLALGGLTQGVTIRELAGAYASIANKGAYKYPKTFIKVLDKDGFILLENYDKIQVFKETTADYILDCMYDTIHTSSGTGKSANLSDSKVAVVGKTGTTSSKKDLLFVGMTPEYTACIWVGYDLPKSVPINNEHKLLWADIMNEISKNTIKYKFDLSSELSLRYIRNKNIFEIKK